ncbi:polysaccharide pyruvyl transferase family protein [Thalassolituus pacificus]|uniref:Polysaccharide pyruvyl transferase family protein n=1 Tax=Thalassolituus pacificus TaxID=2975440 RepID=A0A9X2WGY8_9GAMM|nr:polysaccharide pyruvyl transferase family protein [Thalassolituus pacificus]MCT7360098.1 polysaccharide pyruvyl transferase family protein [Thalassolituus pacificus]
MERIVLFNCYSSSNSGDGLLVDLALEYIRKKHGHDAKISIVASDVDSFEYTACDVIPNEYFKNPSLWMAIVIIFKILVSIIFGTYKSSLYSRFSSYDFAYSVGGGYLRFGSVVEGIKTSIIHLSQLAWIKSNFTNEHIMLAQSIGPFRFLPAFGVKFFIKKAKYIVLRDDRSFNQLSMANAVRSEDMAVAKLKENIKCLPSNSNSTSSSDHCIVVLRDFRRGVEETRSILASIFDSVKCFDNIHYAVQSKVNGNDDQVFYENYGINSDGSLKDLLEIYPDAVVLSVRLHGALEAMICGHKSYHLSYERKGFGAFEDLGLGMFVGNLYDIDPIELGGLLSSLKAMPVNEYFSNVK